MYITNIGFIVLVHKHVSKIRMNKMKQWLYSSGFNGPQLYCKIKLVKMLKRLLSSVLIDLFTFYF